MPRECDTVSSRASAETPSPTGGAWPAAIARAFPAVAFALVLAAPGVEPDARADSRLEPKSLDAPHTVVERSDRAAVTVRFTFDPVRTEPVEVDGGVWQRVHVPGLGHDGVPGWPSVPVYTALVGVPPDVTVTDVVATPRSIRRHDGPPILPAPEAVRRTGERDEDESVPALRFRPRWSESEGSHPARWAVLERVSWWRNRRVAVIHVYPVRTVPGREGFESAGEMVVTLTFAEGAEPAEKPLAARYGDDPMDETIDRQLVNGIDSRAWLRSEAPRPLGRARGRRGAADYFSSAPAWVKVRTRDEGILRVTGAALATAGAPLPVDATTVRVFVGPDRELPFDMPESFEEWLTEVAVRVEDGGDGTIDATSGDRIELFAQSADGFAHHLDSTPSDSTFTMHQYTDERVYWIAWGDGFTSGPPKRMDVEDVTPDAASFTPVDRVTERLHIEENRFYRPAFKAQGHSVGTGRWSKDRWEKWYWNQGYSIADGSVRIVTFEVPEHVDGTAGRVLVRMMGAASTAHRVTLTLNDLATPAYTGWSGYTGRDFLLDAGEEPGYIRSGTNVLGIRVEPDPPRQSDRVLLAFIEVWHTRMLAWGGPLAFDGRALGGATARYTITKIPDATSQVYDVTDPRAPLLLTGAALGGQPGAHTVTFDRLETAPGRRYLVTRPAEHLVPTSVELDVAPPGASYLKERDDPVDYIVIHAGPFEAAGTSLASFRDGNLPGAEDANALAVRLSDVYDEFSGGMIDPTAVRRFLRYAYDTYRDPSAPQAPRLRYATLVGDATFNHRGFGTLTATDYLPAWSERHDSGLIPDWEASWPSDDYFGLLDDALSRLMWIGVGRLPAASEGEANAMVSKIIEHETASERSPWFARTLFVADDLCQGTSWDTSFYQNWVHTRQCEEDLIPALPDAIEKLKVYLVDYPDPARGITCIGTTKPSARDAVIDAINDGVLLLDYVGHGGETVMADERVLVSADIASMGNAGRYFYFVTASCQVGKFDDLGEGLGETVLKRGGAGAVNSLSAAAVAFSGSNILFNRLFLAALFRGRVAHPDSVVPFGDAFIAAKAQVPGESSTNNTRKYNVLGDPAVTQPWPPNTIDLSLAAAAPRERAARLEAREARSLEARRVALSQAPGAPATAARVPDPAGRGAQPDTLWRGELASLSGLIRDRTGQPVPGFTGLARVEVYDSQELRHRDPYEVTGNNGLPQNVTPVDYLLRGAPMYRAELPVAAGEFSTTFFVPTGLRRGLRGEARIVTHVLGDGADDAFSTIEHIHVPDAPRGTTDDEEAPLIEVELDGPEQAVPVSSTIRIRFSDESGIYITELLDSRAALLSFEDAGGFVVVLLDLSSEIVFGEDYRSAEVEVPIPTTLEVGRPYVMTVRASDNVGNRASLARELYFVVSDAPEVQRVFAYPNPASSRTAFFVDVNVAVDVEMDIFTVTGRKIRTLEGAFAAGEGRTRPLSWNLRDDDGDVVANGSYHWVMTVTPREAGAVEKRRGWIAVLR